MDQEIVEIYNYVQTTKHIQAPGFTYTKPYKHAIDTYMPTLNLYRVIFWQEMIKLCAHADGKHSHCSS